MLQIFMVERNCYFPADRYSGHVCVAESEEIARNTHPSGRGLKWNQEELCWKNAGFIDKTWHPPAYLRVTLLGNAKEGSKPGVVFTGYA